MFNIYIYIYIYILLSVKSQNIYTVIDYQFNFQETNSTND